MIQRIQSVYFLLAAVITGLMFAAPMATYLGDTTTFFLKPFSLLDASGMEAVPTTYMGVLIAIATIIPFVTLFLFKTRWLQIRLAIAEMILQGGCIVFVVYYCVMINRSMSIYSIHDFSVGLPAVFPLVSLIFTYLALRGVIKDETLIKSLNRIR